MIQYNQDYKNNISNLEERLNNTQNSKHSPVYRKRGVEGFTPLFCFFRKFEESPLFMKRLLVLFISVLCVLGPVKLYSQAVKPIIDFCLPDPDFDFEIGETIDIYVHVKVKSCATDADTSMYGNLFYWYQTDTMSTISSTLFDYIDSQPYIEFIDYGGKMDTIPFYCDSNQLRASTTGPVNVIIIWPAFTSPSAPVCDSGQYVLPVPVFPAIGLEGIPVEKFGSTAFPNPSNATELVYINSKYSKPVSEVQIYNAMGQLSYQTTFAEGFNPNGYVLPTTDLQSGVYFIHLIYSDKKSEVVKFIKN